LTIELGRDETGKRKRKFVTVKGNKADAQKQLRELLVSVDKGLPINTSKVTVSEFLEQWLRDYVSTNTAPTTLEHYSCMVKKYINPKLSHIQLTKLNPQHVQHMYAYLLEERGLSARTVQYTHRILRQALSHAVKWGLLGRNVCDAVDPPKPRRKEMTALDSADVQRLLDATSQSSYGHVFFLALYTGMRRGELIALRWQDVDFQNKSISVNNTVVRIAGEGLVLSEPKTPHSRRLVTLPPSAVAVLNGLKAIRKDRMEKDGKEWDQSSFIFPSANGGPTDPDSITWAFKKAVRKLGLSNMRFHDLRHTHATLMLKQGVHPKIVSERLGHASVNITLDTYSHVLPGLQEAAAVAFEEALQSPTTEAEITTF